MALCIGALAAHAQDAPIPVEVDAARIEMVDETVAVIGRFVSRQSGVVAAQAEGAVAEVLVAVGDRVATGDPLVVLGTERIALDRDLWQSEREAAQAALDEAEAIRRMEQQALERLDDLTDSAAFSQARFDDQTQQVAAAVAKEAVARAIVLRAEANLALVAYQLDRATIRAPYDGVVALRHTELGSWLDVGDPVVDLVNDALLEIEADVAVDRVAGLEPGTTVTAELADGTTTEAQVRAIGVSEDSQARTRVVRFMPSWTIAAGQRADGETVTLRVPIAAAGQAVTISKDAVVRHGGLAGTFVVLDGMARFHVLELGAPVGSRVVVLQGLVDGDSVIVRGNEELDPAAATPVEPLGAS